MSEIFAKAGQQIRNNIGQLVATVSRDVYRGELLHPDQFIFADGSSCPAVVGEVLPRAIIDFADGQSS